ncbi:MAG: hypothetical protein WDO73_16230 [Ignavibacteriota bacterium]
MWREADHGRDVAFDLLFPRGLELPRRGSPPLRIRRTYHPAHNIGHFRYVEAARIGEDGQPTGDLTLWDDIRFPFDPALRGVADLASVEVRRTIDGSSEVEEDYSCDANGIVKVAICNRTAGYRQEYTLGRWSNAAPPTGYHDYSEAGLGATSPVGSSRSSVTDAASLQFKGLHRGPMRKCPSGGSQEQRAQDRSGPRCSNHVMQEAPAESAPYGLPRRNRQVVTHSAWP